MVKVMWFEPPHEHLPLPNTTTGVPCRRTNTTGVPCRRTNTIEVPSRSPEHLQRSPRILVVRQSLHWLYVFLKSPLLSTIGILKKETKSEPHLSLHSWDNVFSGTIALGAAAMVFAVLGFKATDFTLLYGIPEFF
ncbi:hypothetical protein Hanom_Chr00s000003g01603041 [Helianthus anomalus]